MVERKDKVLITSHHFVSNPQSQCFSPSPQYKAKDWIRQRQEFECDSHDNQEESNVTLHSIFLQSQGRLGNGLLSFYFFPYPTISIQDGFNFKSIQYTYVCRPTYVFLNSDSVLGPYWLKNPCIGTLHMTMLVYNQQQTKIQCGSFTRYCICIVSSQHTVPVPKSNFHPWRKLQ